MENWPSRLNLAYLDQSDHHFRRSNHAARCFRLHQGYHDFAQHSGKLPLRFRAGLSMDASPDMCFLLGISLQARYVKIACRSGFSLPGLLTCAKLPPLIWVCFVHLGLTQAAGLCVVFRYLWTQATGTASEALIAVSKRKC